MATDPPRTSSAHSTSSAPSAPAQAGEGGGVAVARAAHTATRAVYLAAAGDLASGVTAELSVPLREVRDILAVLVETLDRHFADTSGPEAYPWNETKALRERLAETYLTSRSVARLTRDLARAVQVERGAPEEVDLNSLVEQAIALARHRFGDDCEVSIDTGDLPVVRAYPGELVLLLATLLGQAADGAREGGGAVWLRTRREGGSEDGQGDVALIQISDGGGGGAGRDLRQVELLAEHVLGPFGGTLGRTAGLGGGMALLELRLPVVGE